MRLGPDISKNTTSNNYTMITHNISGFDKRIIDSILALESRPAFVNIQETHHLASSKNIYDDSGKYITFHSSSVDESIPNVKRTGGLITYVRADVASKTVIYKKTTRFLIMKNSL